MSLILHKGEVVRFEQDFETNVQGIYPFVVGGIEGVEDNRIHLSERHDKYTQAGWDVKLMDDVLDGDWSVKINGLTQRSKLAYQTIPQNFRFEPGVTYKVSFDYQAGSDDTYGVVVGAGEYTGATNLETLKKSLGTTAHYEREIVGDITGQTWFGIYSTSTAPDLQGVNSSSAQANFGGYKELVLDNLVIEKVEQNITIDTLKDLIATAEGYNKEDYTAADWKKLDDALTKAKVAVNRDKTSADEIESAYYALNGAINYIASIDTNEESSTKNDISVEGVIATAGSEDGGTYGRPASPVRPNAAPSVISVPETNVPPVTRSIDVMTRLPSGGAQEAFRPSSARRRSRDFRHPKRPGAPEGP